MPTALSSLRSLPLVVALGVAALAQEPPSAGAAGAGQDEKKQEKKQDEKKEVRELNTDFFRDLTPDEAMLAASKEEKVVMIFWYSPFDPESRRMRETTWKDEAVRKWVEEVAVPIQIEAGKQPRLDSRFRVNVFPTVQFVRSDEWHLDQIYGYLPPVDFGNQARAIVAGRGNPEKPSGEQATSGTAWLAWANHCYALGAAGTKDAIEAYLWLVDNGESSLQDFRAGYLDFVLKRLMTIARKNGKAETELERRRNRLEVALVEAQAADWEVDVIERLNFWLRDEDRTLLIYDSLKGRGERQEHFRELLFPSVLKPLRGYRRYLDIVEMRGDLLAEVKARAAEIEKSRAELVKDGRELTLEETIDLDERRKTLVTDAGYYYETLLGLGRGADAKELVDFMTEYNPRARTYKVFMDGAIRLDHQALAESIGKVALEKIDDGSEKMIERTLRKMRAGGSHEDEDSDSDDGDGDGDGE